VLDEPTTPVLTDSQRRIVGSALTLLAFLGSIALLIGAFIVLGRLLAFFSSVLWPLAVAGVLALILRPPVAALARRLKLRRFTAVVLLYVVVVLLTAGALLVLVPPLIRQLIDFIEYIPTLWMNAWDYVQLHYPEWIELVQEKLADPSIRNIADSIAAESKALFTHAIPSVRAAFGGVLDVVAFLTHLAIIPVYLFFFLLMRGEPTSKLDPRGNASAIPASPSAESASRKGTAVSGQMTRVTPASPGERVRAM
jgi:predicted PurR-regulated permease PerM